MAQKGKFITIEGGDGAGKSSQIIALKEWLENQEIDVITTREPGGSEGAEEIRKLVLTGAEDKWDPLTEAFLFFAARRDHIIKKIKPALDEGKWVISDRYVHSSYAYQGYGHGIDMDILKNLYDIVRESFQPDLTILLDIDPVEGLKRTKGRQGQAAVEDRFENIELSFHERLRTGFLEMAENEKDLFAVIATTNLSLEDVHKAIIDSVTTRLLP